MDALVGSLAPSLAPTPPRKGFLKLKPVNARRLANFKRNRRGYISFWIFLLLFVTSLFAEFIANDRPIIASYKGEILYPVLFDYPEDKFGGFLANTDYRDPVIADEIKAHGWMLWPPIRFAYNTENRDLPTPAPSAPTWSLHDGDCRAMAEKAGPVIAPGSACQHIEWNWLGTDDRAHDVVASAIYGFRISIVFGLILAILSSIVGIAAGAVQGFFGGLTDLIFQRFIEIWTALPQLYLLIIIASIIKPSFGLLLGILLLFSWVALVHVVRAEFLRARNLEYVTAARALGLSNVRIMVKHVLPNAMVATMTFLPFVLNASVSMLTSLQFLGLALPPGSPSLGDLLLQGKGNLQAPWLALTGFFIIATMLSLLIFVGEAVRDAFDPRKKVA